MSWGDYDRWYFEGVESLLEGARRADPDTTYVPGVLMPADFPHTEGRRVGWAKTAPTVRVEVEKVSFTDNNPWNLGHVAALAELMRRGIYPVLRPAVARVYRIDEEDVRDTQAEHESFDLSYERDMERPWEPSDVGTLRADLVDGNHRVLAAMLAGESYVDVTVSPMTERDVLPEEWLENPPCPFCEPTGKTLYEDGVAWVGLCSDCGDPIVTLRRHTPEVSNKQAVYALRMLSRHGAPELYRMHGPGHYRLDLAQHPLTDHWHIHCRVR